MLFPTGFTCTIGLAYPPCIQASLASSLIEDNMQQIERMRSDAARAASLLGSLTPPEGSVA